MSIQGREGIPSRPRNKKVTTLFPWHNLLTFDPLYIQIMGIFIYFEIIFTFKNHNDFLQNIKALPWRYTPRRCFWSTSRTSLTFAKTSDGDGCSKSVIIDSKRMIMILGWLSTTAKREGQDARGLRIYFSNIWPEKLHEHSSKITRRNFYVKAYQKQKIFQSNNNNKRYIYIYHALAG